jgi:hypothetical protein
VWICGNENHYYLIPTHVLKQIYDSPDSYPDGEHPEIRIISVDSQGHECLCGRGGQRINLSDFFRKTL